MAEIARDNAFAIDTYGYQLPLDSAIKDDGQLIEATHASTEVLVLMPVFKDYTRATLGIEPRRTIADNVNQFWPKPGDFRDYSYDQVAEVCPEGFCPGALPGSASDLSGHIRASSVEFSPLAPSDRLIKASDEKNSGTSAEGPGPDAHYANRTKNQEFSECCSEHPVCHVINCSSLPVIFQLLPLEVN